MPLTRFTCPDGNEVEIKECLQESGCRLKKRCLTLATLKALGKTRTWKGVPSTTQLLRGTYEAFLELTIDYAESPDSMMFRLLGTSVHGALEKDEDIAGATLEKRFISSDGISGIPDIVETEDGWNILTDYKTSGGYKVNKALGMYAVLEESDIPLAKKTHITDPQTKEKVTREKGEKKLVKVWKQDLNKQDCWDWVMQLNHYRIMFEKEEGIMVNEIRVQAICRDGGLQAQQRFGLTRNSYIIPIPHIDDAKVLAYFLDKKDSLMAALEVGDWSDQCTYEERWGDNKCMKYCSVKPYCKFMKNQWMEE